MLYFDNLSPDTADAYLADGVTEELIAAAAQAVLQRDSTSSDAWMAYGVHRFLRQRGSPDDALAAERRSVALDSGNAEALNLLGMILFATGRDSSAAAAFRRSLAIEPGRPITLMRLAEVAWIASRYDDARRLLDSAIAAAPEFHTAYVDRAWVGLHFHDVAAATADAETTLRLAPEDFAAGRGVLAAAQAIGGDTLHAYVALDSLADVLVESGQIGHLQIYYVALPLVAVGDTARALDLIERARPRGANLGWMLRLPEFAPIRFTARFRRVVDEANPLSAGP